MSDEFKEFDEAPTPVLTFGAPGTEEKEVPAEPEKPEEPLWRAGVIELKTRSKACL